MTVMITPLIVCGGSGTRLWPASRASRPKQFLLLFGQLSTFQETILRVADPGLFGKPVVVTSERHRFLVADQLEEMGVEADVILEPEPRDSGPAILAGALYAAERDGADAVVLSLAADHMIRNVAGFRDSCRLAVGAAQAGRIVTFGVAPDYPATGFGYVQPGEPLYDGVRAVARFVEKPDLETATAYVRDGYLWNSGNFAFEASILIAEYERLEPDTVRSVEAAVARRSAENGFLRLDAVSFAQAPKRSVDYAVMEHAPTAVVRATFDWSDVGSWDAVHDLVPHDAAGNSARCEATFVNAHDNFALSDGAMIALVGLDGLCVVATEDAVLVARREDASGIRTLVQALNASGSRLTEDRLALISSTRVAPSSRDAGRSRTLPRSPTEIASIPVEALRRMDDHGDARAIIDAQTGGRIKHPAAARLEEDARQQAAS